MVKIIIKRDGREVEFDKSRIVKAIEKAMERTEKGIDLELAYKIADSISKTEKKRLEIEEIQNTVENKLMASNRKDVAKEYITYRHQRSIEREKRGYLNKQIQGLFDASNIDVLKDNANKDGSKMHSYRAMISDITCKNYAIKNMLPKNIVDAHEEGSIYFHDINYACLPFFNCMLINWRDMLDNGFEVEGTKIDEIKSVTTAVALLSQIVAHVSSNCYGGLTLSDLDLGLDTYIDKSFRKHLEVGTKWILGESHVFNYDNVSMNDVRTFATEKLQRVWDYAVERTEKEVYDAMQGLEYEIQTLTNARAEVPFLTISFGQSTTTNGRLIQKAILETRLKGLTGDVTPVFPKQIFILKESVNVDKNDPNYDLFQLAIKTTSRRLYPDYVSYKNVVRNTGDFKSPMSCRSFLSTFIDENGNIITDGRFNQGVVSINLVRLAIKSQGNEKEFYRLLDEALELTRQGLMYRHNMLKGVKAKQAPILYMSGAVARLNPEDTIDHLLMNGYSTLSIGYIGLANVSKMLYGGYFEEDEEVNNKTLAILQYMRDYANKLKKETGLGFSIYSTPSESMTARVCEKDVKDFGIIEGVNDKEYYENSFHVRVDYEMTPFDKIDFESVFSPVASGGAIHYTQYGDMTKNLKALEDIARYCYDKVHYFGFNVAGDKCHECNYIGEIKPQTLDKTDYKCPKCGNTDLTRMNVIRRVSGYLFPASVRSCLSGKMKEIHSRKNNLEV